MLSVVQGIKQQFSNVQIHPKLKIHILKIKLQAEKHSVSITVLLFGL